MVAGDYVPASWNVRHYYDRRYLPQGGRRQDGQGQPDAVRADHGVAGGADAPGLLGQGRGRSERAFKTR